MATAWAVTDSDGKINVCTVHDSRRGAIVNWLVVAKRIEVLDRHTDEQIEKMWAASCGDAMVGLVSITPIHN